MAVTYNLKGTTNSSFKVGKSGNGTVEIGAIDSTGASGSAASITGHLVPSANVTYDLGSTSNYWRDLYLGPGSLYVNGKKVIEDDSGTITFSTDENQNLSISTSGTGQTTLSSVAGLNLTATSSGDITFTTSTGQINFDGDVIVNAANSINSSNAEPIAFADPISVTGNSTMANLTITGNLTVQGTTTTIDSTTVQIQNAFVFEGATDDTYETTLTVTDPTADRTITLPNATGTVVLQDSTDTLSNKTISLTNNTLSGTTAEFNSALSDGSFATLAGTETLTNKTLTSPTVTGNVAFDTDVLFVDATNNRVGVNTSSPADPFVVKQGTGETRFGGTNGRTLSAYDNGTLNNFDFKANQIYFEADLLVNGAKKISTHNGSTNNLYLTTNDATKAIYTDRDIITDGDLIFEGATADAYETTLTVTDPTADRTITLPDATGTVALTNSFTHFHSSAQTVTSGEATTNASASVDYTFSELSGAIHYVAFLNRTLMRASEYSISGTTLTVNSGVLATDDQIEVTGFSV